ncbi:hypothetical protein KUTeg_011619 [Tegillarca granosa]|uniref:Uncharacterized protein n=1 Tax=Tegillarca granosa TaxID=220873 RepID=A0ABQ9EX54_TEGGR|nr:hypothetical protein KUTeg_011619 [Tegillarca granosa]
MGKKPCDENAAMGKKPCEEKRCDGTMASQHTDRYEFDGEKRGRAVIICNAKFWKNSRYSYRFGATKDLKNMKKLFTRLGFSVKEYSNLTAGEIEDNLKKIAELEKKKPKADCFVCVISSHGEQTVESEPGGYVTYHKHTVVGVDGESVETANLISLFEDKNCASLKGKPKFFFIQACRADKYFLGKDEGWDSGVKYQTTCGHDRNMTQRKEQGKDTIDKQTKSSSNEITQNEAEEEKMASQFNDKKSNSDLGPKESMNQAGLCTDKSQPDNKERGVSGDTIDARNPDAKEMKTSIDSEKCVIGDAIDALKEDAPSVKTDVRNVSSDIADTRGIPHREELVIPPKEEPAPTKTEIVDVISVPCFTDMMIMFASPPGKYAIRSQVEGSWMISVLYSYMKDCNFKLEDKDFLSSLVEISGIIARDFEFKPGDKNCKDYEGKLFFR